MPALNSTQVETLMANGPEAMFIGVAIIGLGLMLAGIAYGLYQAIK